MSQIKENPAKAAPAVDQHENAENSSEGTFLSPPSFSLTAAPVQAKADPVQMQTNDEEPGTAVEDAGTYYVTDSNASIRSNTNPNSFPGGKIPAGTKVKRLRTYSGSKGTASQVEVLVAATGSTTTVGTTYWTTATNISAASTVTDAAQYFVNYSDTYVYNEPGGSKKTTTTDGATTNDTVGASNTVGYTKAEECGPYVRIMQGTTDKGWIHGSGLLTQAKADRGVYMGTLETWLEARYTEVAALEGEAQKTRAKGILSLVEDVSHQIESGTYPEVSGLSTTPAYAAHDYSTFTQPELTATVRKFIEVIEAGDGDGDINWNAQLGVPQYRTQSDNLAPPEATCGPTSFTMGAERLGHSREDMIAAIDEKLTGHRRLEYRKYKWKETEYRKAQYLASPEGVAAAASGAAIVVPESYLPSPAIPAAFVAATAMTNSFLLNVSVPTDFTPATAFPEADLDTKWETKGEEFLKSFSGDNWQKLRNGTSGGLIGKEDDVAENFRDWGQFEDFSYFRAWLDGVSRGNVANGSSQDMLDHLENPSRGSEDAAGTNSRTIDFNNGEEFTMAHREEIRTNLQEGGSVILSFYHKGTKAGTHIVTVREVVSDGLLLDDPFGQINPEYRQGVAGDAYKDKGGTQGRGSYDWRNPQHHDKTETDYAERDFGKEAGQELESDESRGKDSKITWAMIDESTRLLFYIALYSRP